MAIESFTSRLDDPKSRRFGTFSYLPPLDRDQVERQVEYMLDRGWDCGVEHVEPSRASNGYWYFWKLPLFGATTSREVLAEVDGCRSKHPEDLVRLVGYDRHRQTLGLAFVVHSGGSP